MDINKKMMAFEAIGRGIMESAKVQGHFHVIALKDSGYRVQLEVGKRKFGWALPPRTRAKDFEKEFEKRVELVLK